MKTFLKRLLGITYMITCLLILCYTIVHPFALSYDETPLWTCITYPLSIIVIASMPQLTEYFKDVN